MFSYGVFVDSKIPGDGGSFIKTNVSSI